MACTAVLCPNDGSVYVCFNCDATYCSKICMLQDAERHECEIGAFSGLRGRSSFGRVLAEYADSIAQYIASKKRTTTQKENKKLAFLLRERVDALKKMLSSVRHSFRDDIFKDRTGILQVKFNEMHAILERNSSMLQSTRKDTIVNFVNALYYFVGLPTMTEHDIHVESILEALTALQKGQGDKESLVEAFKNLGDMADAQFATISKGKSKQ